MMEETNSPNPTLTDNGAFSVDVRRCALELVSLEVATDKVAAVMSSVSQCIFGVHLPASRFPQRQSVLRITDEAQFLIKVMYSELLTAASHFGLHKDGTSRQKQKILGNSGTIEGEGVRPLGYRRIASETGVTITETAKLELSEVASCGNTTIHRIVNKLTYVMSDRTANEKLSHRQKRSGKRI
ncbi:uncharacterized protein LOC135501664 [Lineus longissimus]|uniref:uncharacterized protein LOC135501664 n=1 Tax=Lineus longissimus TaxID=88925 RepID=UPI00315CF376